MGFKKALMGDLVKDFPWISMSCPWLTFPYRCSVASTCDILLSAKVFPIPIECLTCQVRVAESDNLDGLTEMLYLHFVKLQGRTKQKRRAIGTGFDLDPYAGNYPRIIQNSHVLIQRRYECFGKQLFRPVLGCVFTRGKLLAHLSQYIHPQLMAYAT